MEETEIKKMVKDITHLIEENKKSLIQNVVSPIHPADLAEILYHLSEEHRELIFSLLDTETASEVLARLDEHSRDHILEELEPKRITEIVEEMDSDDVTDLLSQLPEEVSEEVLSEMDREDSDEVKELLQHDEKTAGGIMAKEFVSIEESRTVDEAIAEVRSRADEVEDVYYVFVVDDRGVLVGVLSLKRLILAPADTKVLEIMNRDVISVKTSKDQEEVAHIARKYDLVSTPVVDDFGILVGRITIDDIVDVMDEEVSEDIHKMAGIGEEVDLSEPSSFRISRVRLPWLIIGLIGGVFAALIISSYEYSLKNLISLSFFTPVIMAMGGNIGIQSSTIVVRGLATGEISFFDSYKHLFKEIKVGLLNGMICSILFFFIAYLWQDIRLGILLGGSLFLVMNVAVIVGALVPLVLKRMDIDPAIATGPFITISNDIFGLLIYFSLATSFLGAD